MWNNQGYPQQNAAWQMPGPGAGFGMPTSGSPPAFPNAAGSPYAPPPPTGAPDPFAYPGSAAYAPPPPGPPPNWAPPSTGPPAFGSPPPIGPPAGVAPPPVPADRAPGLFTPGYYNPAAPTAPTTGPSLTHSWDPRKGPAPAAPAPAVNTHHGAPPYNPSYSGAPQPHGLAHASTPSYPGSQPAAGAHMPPASMQSYGAPGNANLSYQYSQCTGTKKALLIGINYYGQQGELRGCINDAQNVRKFLIERFGYKPGDIVMLLDNSRDPKNIPTRDNILHGMQWLVAGAKPNDSLFFHYSGHGGQIKDTDGDEHDGFDEVIYPVDWRRHPRNQGVIVDDRMHEIMVKSLPAGCRLTAIFDSCHSGSALDLPYIYSTEGKIKEPNLGLEAGKDAIGIVKAYMAKDMKGVLEGAGGLFSKVSGSNSRAQERARKTRTSAADVISWSGCKDEQTSADAYEAGKATGAMSYAFITSLNLQPNQTYQQLLVSIREILRAKYSQKPQLSSSHPMDTSILFIA